MAGLDNSDPDYCIKKSLSYFVIKCRSLESLQKCIATEVWAFRRRAKSPQPQDILEKAHFKPNSKVILVFSVNNQHGWHGYCESLYPLKPKDSDTDYTRTKISNEDEKDVDCRDQWCHFSVKWITHFQSLNSYECLPFDKTKDMNLLDGVCVNKARNWQEMSQEVGSRMCEFIDQHFITLHDNLLALNNLNLEEIKAKESFFKDEESSTYFNEDNSTAWQSVIEKVESDLGKVILACPFGSQRYNCNLPGSDSDVLVIYQAKTADVLGLDKPPQTIKNSFSAKMDYTILELQRYCELLVAGDPRYIETLFIEEESIIAFSSESWKELRDLKYLLLTKDCLDKYLREARGTKGIKQFEKWKSEMKDSTERPAQKINKLAYIILRLLQNGRDIVKHGCIKVYRKEDSTERQELIHARMGHYSVSELQERFMRYIDEIEKDKEHVSFSHFDVTKTQIQQWLVKTRLHNLRIDENFDSLMLK